MYIRTHTFVMYNIIYNKLLLLCMLYALGICGNTKQK